MPNDDRWAIPAGTEVLPHDAPRDAWLAERRNGLGGSDMPLLLGVANPRHGSEYELWLEKTGRAGDADSPTGAMIRGVWLEPNLADYFVERTGIECRPAGLCRSNVDPIIRQTPDRLTADGGLVEIKSVSNYAIVRHEWRNGGSGRAAYVQGQTGLLVTGRSPLWLVAYEIDQDPVIRGPFPPDLELHERIRARAREWWDRHVVADEAPPVDLATITDDEIRARWPDLSGDSVEAPYPAHVRMMLAERAKVHAAETTAKRRKREIDTALRVMSGEHRALTIDGEPVVTYSEFDGAAHPLPELEWDHPDIWDRYIVRPRTRRINIVKGKAR